MQRNQLESATPVSLRLLVVTYLVHCAVSVFVNQIFFPLGLGDAVEDASGGVVNSGLQANLLLMVSTLPMLVIAGKQGCREFWFDRNSWQIALVWLLGLTVLYQICVVGFAGWGELRLSDAWSGRPGLVSFGKLLAQLFGNALYEELIFRAFFLTQLYLQLRSRNCSIAGSLAIAIVASQVLFALMHVPNRLYKGTYDSTAAIAFDQIALFLFGLFYAVVLLVFRNLSVPVVLHAIWNVPPTLLTSSDADWSADASLNAFRLSTLLVVIGGGLAVSVWRSRKARVNGNRDGFNGSVKRQGDQ